MKKLNYYSKLPIIRASGRLGIRRALTLSFSFCFLTVLLYSMGSSYEYDRSSVDDSFIVDKEVKSNSSVHNERTSDGMTLEMKGASGENVLDGCDFFFTRAQILPNGNYYFCVVSSMPAQAVKWVVQQGTGAQITEYGSEACFTFSGGPNNFFIEHYTSTDTCFNFLTITENYTCPLDFFEVIQEDTCGTDVALVIDFSKFNNNYEYVIDWGDGTYTQSLADTLFHSYCEPEKYDVCITFVAPSSMGEVSFYTCCYEVDLENEDCICLPGLIANTGQMCDTVCISVTYPDILDGRPIRVTLPGGSPVQLTGDTTIKHIFSASGVYEICFDYTWCETVRQCCYNVPVNTECCASADFTFEINHEQEISSCINPEYIIEDCCTLGAPNEHIWIFDDGFIYEGPCPPSPYRFTDFVNDKDSVCITHIIICCGDTIDVVKKCLFRENGVWLGRPGETRRLTDVMLNQTWGETVHDFLLNTYQGPAPFFPLIDGTLILDEPSDFEHGRFYMGTNAEIINEEQHFGLSNMRIQSAWRFPGRLYSCCFWLGVHSQGDTEMVWDSSEVSDAHFMLHYPSGSPEAVPVIDLVSNFFHTNMFGIKSVGQDVTVRQFHDNELVGEDPSLNNSNSCGCSAINAIDFRYINSAENINFPNTGGVNTIRDYEHGFHMVDANLQARNFRIWNLREMTTPVPPSGNWANFDKRGIGINYWWLWSGANSFLNFDEMDFQSMDVGVELNSESGLHTLRADASVVDATGANSSIKFYDVGAGYHMNFNAGLVDGLIEGNYLDVRRTGIYGGLYGEPDAIMQVIKNDIKVTNSESSWPMNGILFTTWNMTHEVLIMLNDIQAQGVSGGNAIWINGPQETNVEYNHIHAAGDNVSGIRFTNGGESLIRCNTVDDVHRGIDVANSVTNEYGKNFLRYNRHDFYVVGDIQGNGGSLIRWNTMQQSNWESVMYEANAITGPQVHSFFNRWVGQFGNEAVHLAGTGPNAFGSRFHFPHGAALGSIHYPAHTPSVLFAPTTEGFEDNINYCIAHPTTQGPFLSPIVIGYPSDSVYNEILLDTNSFVGYTAAQQLDFDLQLYDLINNNPSWKSAYTSLSDFFDLHENGYVGESVSLQDSIKILTKDMKLQRQSLSAWQSEMDTLSHELSAQFTSLSACNDQSCIDSVGLLINSLRIEADSIETLISDQNDLFVQENHSRISDYLTLNSSLSDTALYEWSERIVVDVMLRLMKSDTLTPQDKQDLETIAMSCDEDAGKWVYTARVLCWKLYQEHYEEQNCIQAVLMNEQKTIKLLEPQLMVNPNPANQEFRVEWTGTESSDGKFDLHIFDLNGREISKIQGVESGVVVDASAWVDGIYILKLLGQNGSMSGKVIINH